MELSNNLISEFVKITNDKEETKKETTVYGTTVEYEGKTYVKLDGSDRLTPISATADTNPGERVTVMIKNHTATITGNISSPAARLDDLKNTTSDVSEIGNQITEMEIAIADKVSTKQLDAEKARIDVLQSENITIKNELTAQKADIDELAADNATINEKLVANEAEIEKLQTDKLDAEIADLTYATISELDATNADLHNLTSTYGEFASLTAEQLEALEASVAKLEAGEITVEELKAIFATIEQLDVEKARIDDLEAEVGDIDTLIFGSATGSVIQTSFANAVIAQLGNAQIKSAMIESVTANKITSGEVNTNKVDIVSEDGKLLISDETIQISDDTGVRVQIGKDAAGDYSINIWDAEGNLMFSKGGITDSAIKEAIIRNDMVSDTANIAAHKLDIDSLFEEINGSEKTIKSARIYLDDKSQTLDMAFETMSSDIEELQNGVTSQGTQITAMQGQIAAKIWQTDIDTAIDEVNTTTDNLSTQYEEVVQDIDGLTATVASHTSTLESKADSSTVTEVSDKVASLETDLSGFQTSVSSTYVTKTEFNDLEIGGRNLYKRTGDFDSAYWSSYTSLEPYENDSAYKQAVCGSDVNGYLLSTLTSVQGFCFDDPNKTYTISAMMKGTGDDQMISVTLDADRVAWYGTKVTNGSWKKMVWTFAGSKSLITFRFTGTNVSADSPVYIAQVKVEEGDKATAWTPAPEDVSSDIAIAQSTAESAQATANQNAKDMANVVTNFNNDIANLQTQIDGSITTWFYEVAPTDSNEPAVNWTTTDLKNIHLGDLYYDTITGYCYRWQVQNNTYSWQRITDTDVTKALSDAQAAQDTADQKRRVFYTTPAPPYDKGDLWVQGGDGDILRCSTAKASGQSYSASDWVVASKYTDDTIANEAKEAAATAQNTAENAQSSIDNLEIGGRNLIVRSQSTENAYYDQNGTFVANSGSGTAAMTTYISIKPNTKYTFSRSAGGGDYFRFNWYDSEKNYISRKAITEIGDGLAGTFTWTSPSNAYYLLVSYPWDETSRAKLERGDKATDWTPAPEDVQNDIETVESRVTTAETKISQNTDSITSVANRTTTVENKFAEYSTTEQMNSAIQQKADSIVSSVASTYTTKTELKKLKVGGTNLLRNSNFANGTQYWTPASASTAVIPDDMFDQCLTFSTAEAGSSSYRIYADTVNSFTHQAGVEYTLSFWAKASEATTIQTNTAGSGNAVDHTVTTTWQKFVKTYTTSSTGSITFWPNEANVTIYLANVKLELGHVASDWTPSPDDMATTNDVEAVQLSVDSAEERITTTESLIQQLSDCIATLVVDSNGQSLMTQTDTGWTFSTGDIQSTVDSTSENLDLLTNEVGDINSAVGILQQAVDDLGVLSEYVKITTYEGEPCIELGETDSDFKLLITNTRILFMEGNSVPAYINNQSLHIKKAVIEEELQQGEFIWKARSNGNLGLIWKGAAN